MTACRAALFLLELHLNAYKRHQVFFHGRNFEGQNSLGSCHLSKYILQIKYIKTKPFSVDALLDKPFVKIGFEKGISITFPKSNCMNLERKEDAKFFATDVRASRFSNLIPAVLRRAYEVDVSHFIILPHHHPQSHINRHEERYFDAHLGFHETRRLVPFR